MCINDEKNKVSSLKQKCWLPSPYPCLKLWKCPSIYAPLMFHQSPFVEKSFWRHAVMPFDIWHGIVVVRSPAQCLYSDAAMDKLAPWCSSNIFSKTFLKFLTKLPTTSPNLLMDAISFIINDIVMCQRMGFPANHPTKWATTSQNLCCLLTNGA